MTPTPRIDRNREVRAAFYTVRQVCVILQVDRKTVYKLIEADQLPGTTRVRGDYRIPRGSVDRLSV
jgi:excisionase family DNA binding protein